MNIELIINLFHTAIVLVVVVIAVRSISRGNRSLKLIFFTLAFLCTLLSDMYWLAFEIMRPETRMPFAANEISELALFLLLGAALKETGVQAIASAKQEVIFAILFCAASTALWIAWSGEWVQDILTGAAYGYFLFRLVVYIKTHKAFSTWMWRLAGILCLIIVIAQAFIFFVPAGIKQPLDIFCYVMLFASQILLFAGTIRELAKCCDPAHGISLAFALLAWSVTVMYMSEGTYYVAATIISALSIPIMLYAINREVKA